MKTPMIHLTAHASRRAAQRGISEAMISVAVCYGEVIYKQGLRYFICLEKNIRGIFSPSCIDQFKDTVIILSADDALITCYKNKNAFSHIRKKFKRLEKRKY